MLAIFLLWLGFAIIVGVAAHTRGRAGGGWFLLAVVISPLLAGLLLLALPRRKQPITFSEKLCPYCAERIQRAAIVCRYCGRNLDDDPAEAKETSRSRATSGAIVSGNGRYRFEVVGESHYQSELEEIAGPRTEQGVQYDCVGILLPEPNNAYDTNAVCVQIAGRTVAYLARDHARELNAALAGGGYALAACRARIVGGWNRGPDDNGSFGVKLDAILPFQLQTGAKAAQPQKTGGSIPFTELFAKRVVIVTVIIGLILAVLFMISTLNTPSSTFRSAAPPPTITPEISETRVEMPMPRARPQR